MISVSRANHFPFLIYVKQASYILVAIFFGFLFLTNTLAPYIQQDNYPYNPVILLIGSITAIFLFLVVKKIFGFMTEKQHSILAVSVLALMLLIQIFYITQFQSVTYWDYSQMYSNAISLNQSGQIVNESLYTQKWTFFLPLTLLMKWLFLLSDAFGMSYRIMINIVTLLCMDSAIVMAYFLIRKRLSYQLSTLFAIFCLLNPIIYIRTVYFYSDTVVMPAMIAMLILYLKALENNSRKKWIYWIGAAVCAAVSFEFRATAIIYFLAILVHLFLVVKIKEFAKMIGIALCILFAIIRSYTFFLQDQYIPDAHPASPAYYFLVGSHMDSYGSNSDTQTSDLLNITDREERRAAIHNRLREKWDEYGKSGYVHLFYTKVLKLWTVSTGGSRTGSFHQAEYNYPLYSFVYGERAAFLQYYGQVIKGSLLLLCAFAALALLRKKESLEHHILFVNNIFFVGFTVFYMGWHNEPRCFFLILVPLLINGVFGLVYLSDLTDQTISAMQLIEKKMGFDSRKYLCRVGRVSFAFMGLCILLIWVDNYYLYVNRDIDHKQWSVQQQSSGAAATSELIGEMVAGDVVEQTFRTRNGINHIQVGFRVFDQQIDSTYHLELVHVESKNILAQWPFTIQDLSKDGKLSLHLDETIYPMGQEEYRLRIYSNNASPGNALGICVYSIPNYDIVPNGELFYNTEELPLMDLQFVVMNQYKQPLVNSRVYILVGIVIFAVMFAAWYCFEKLFLSWKDS